MDERPLEQAESIYLPVDLSRAVRDTKVDGLHRDGGSQQARVFSQEEWRTNSSGGARWIGSDRREICDESPSQGANLPSDCVHTSAEAIAKIAEPIVVRARPAIRVPAAQGKSLLLGFSAKAPQAARRTKEQILSLTWSDSLEAGTIIRRAEFNKNKLPSVLPMVDYVREIIERRWQARLVMTAKGPQVCDQVFHREGNRIKDFRGAWETPCIKAGLQGR